MSTETKPLISLPFIVFAAVLLLGGIFLGPKIMAWYMLQGEAERAKQIIEPEKFADLSAWAKSLQEDPEAEPPSDLEVGSSPDAGRGRPDPEARFAEMDADEDGKLTGDEIQGRLVENIDSFDTDANGEITKEEFLGAIEKMRSGGGRGGRGGRPASETEEGDSASKPEEKSGDE